jgi:hypothetical protein
MIAKASRYGAAAALLCASGIALIAPSAALAQSSSQPTDGWKVSGSVRLRYEAVDGQVRPGFNAGDGLVNLRTTVFAEHRGGPLRLGAELYDSRAWGADRAMPISTSEVNTLELVQAYAALDVKSAVLGPTTLQAGRFLLNLGSRRLVAADDYRNTTNSYTGLRADLTPAGVKTSLIYVQPQVRLPDGIDALLDNRQQIDRESRALELWGGVAAKPRTIGPATLEGSYFHLEERDAPGRPTRDRSLDTFGGRIIRDPQTSHWDYELEAFDQTGEISRGLGPTDPKLKVRAGFAHADVGYSFAHRLRPRFSAEFDVATGDDGHSSYGRFDTLFGMRRADLAPAGLYNAVGRSNLITPGLRLELAPPGRWDAFAVVRGLWVEAKEDAFSTTGVRDAAGRSGTFAGTQLEGRARYWLVKDRIRAEADAVWLDKGRFLQRAPNAPPTGDERYLSLNLTAQY